MTTHCRCFLVLAVVVTALAIGCKNYPTRPDQPGAQCGGLQGIPCAAGQLCELPAGQCEGADLTGVCLPIPHVCTEEFDPVCGCNGVSYGNDCLRLMAGVQKAGDGECLSAGTN